MKSNDVENAQFNLSKVERMAARQSMAATLCLHFPTERKNLKLWTNSFVDCRRPNNKFIYWLKLECLPILLRDPLHRTSDVFCRIIFHSPRSVDHLRQTEIADGKTTKELSNSSRCVFDANSTWWLNVLLLLASHRCTWRSIFSKRNDDIAEISFVSI